MPLHCGQRDDGIFLWLSAVLLLALALLFFSASAVYPQNLPAPNDPWLTLKRLIDSQPQALLSYNENLTAQIEQLQSSNDNLTRQLRALSRSNEALRESLQQSQAAAAASKVALGKSQVSLISSMRYITEAQRKARILEARNKLLGIGFTVAVAVIAVAGAYAGGRAAHLW